MIFNNKLAIIIKLFNRLAKNLFTLISSVLWKVVTAGYIANKKRFYLVLEI